MDAPGNPSTWFQGLFLILLCAITARAEDRIVIDAQRTEYRQGITILEGHVRFSNPGQFLITADRARYNTETFSAELEGNVKMDYYSKVGVIEIASQYVQYSFETSTGVFHGVEAQFGGSFQFTGEQIEHLEDDQFLIRSGRLTACNQAKPHWSLDVKEALLVREGYSRLKHTVFRLGGIPVFYIPYMILPTMQSRKSGLLLPETGNSQRNGTYIKVPIYLAPREDWDITLTPGYFHSSGASLDVEARYYTQPQKKGLFNGFVIEDKVIATGPDVWEAGKKLSDHRFRFNFQHEQKIGRAALLLEADQRSDYQVEWDFVEDINSGRTRDSLYKIWFGSSMKGQFFSVELNKNERIFSDESGIGEMNHLPNFHWVIPARDLGAGFILKANSHAGFTEHNYTIDENLESAFRYSLHADIKKASQLGSYLYTNYGVSLLGNRYRGQDDTRTNLVPAGTFEVFGPKLYKSFKTGRFEQFITYGVSMRYNHVSDPLLEDDLEFNEVDSFLGEQIDGLDTSWLIRSSLFRKDRNHSQPFLELEMRKKVNTETRKSPLEIALRVPGYRGFHFNSLIRYRTDEGEFDLLSFYGSAVKRNWKGYAGYVKRQTGLNDQDSIILRSDLLIPNLQSKLHVAMDYDFLQQDFKSREFSYKLIGQCVSFQASYFETPEASSGETKKWYRVTFSFKNLGEVGSKF